MFVVKFVVLLVCFALNNAFLLDNTPSTGQTLGSNQYLTVDDKVLINHELDEIRRDHERSLNILTSQLQQKFADLEKALSQNKTNSELLRKITGLQNENQELQTNFTELQQKFADLEKALSQNKTNSELLRKITGLQNENQELQTNFTELQRSFYILQNNYDSLKLATESQTMNLKTDVISLKQLQSIQQLQGLQDLRSKVHTIDSAVNILQSHELARNQDFISFYNTTRYEINKLQGKSNDNEIEINRLNIFLAYNESEVSSRLGSLQLLLEKQIKQFELQRDDNLRTERFQNQSLTSLQQETEKVVLMGCVTSIRVAKSSEILNFPNILQSSGMNDISSIRLAGKFICEKAGFYFISVVIASNSDKAGFQITKNDDTLTYAWNIGNSTFYSSFTAIAVVELHTNDNIKIVTDRNFSIYYRDSSCITIFKL